MEHAIVTLEFPQQKDFSLAFCAVTDEKGSLSGLRLMAQRGTEPAYHVDADIMRRIFQPRIEPLKGQMRWRLTLRPLTQSITIVKQKTRFVVLYAFQDVLVRAKVDRVVVKGQRTPLQMSCEVYGKYRASRDAAPIVVKDEFLCEDAFTQELFHTFTKNE